MITQGDFWRGPLSDWPPGARLQKQYFGNDDASAFAVVRCVHRLREPKELFYFIDDRGAERKLEVASRNIIFRPVGIRGREVFADPWPPPAWRGTGSHAIQFPDVLAKAVMDGTIKEILLLPQWHALWPNFPPTPAAAEPVPVPAGDAVPENHPPSSTHIAPSTTGRSTLQVGSGHCGCSWRPGCCGVRKTRDLA